MPHYDMVDAIILAVSFLGPVVALIIFFVMDAKLTQKVDRYEGSVFRYLKETAEDVTKTR